MEEQTEISELDAQKQDKLKPVFDLTNFQVKPLTCSESDLAWNMTLPEVINPDSLEYSIAMTTETRSIIYEAEESRVVLHKTYEDLLTRGFNCPSVTLIPLTFEIYIKDLKETIIQMIGVPVELAPMEIPDEDIQYEPLIIEQLEVSVNGILTVTFNKDLIKLSIDVGDPLEAQNRTL